MLILESLAILVLNAHVVLNILGGFLSLLLPIDKCLFLLHWFLGNHRDLGSVLSKF